MKFLPVMRLLVPFLICLSLAQASHAGAWLREQGTNFASISFSSTYFRDTASQTYMEFGISDSTTLGANIGLLQSRFGEQSGYATFFLRRGIGPPDRTSKWSYEVGVGASWYGDTILPNLHTGLNWGRGITWGGKSGWMNVDTSVTWDTTYHRHIKKIDSTVGLNFTNKTAGMMQLYLSHFGGKSYATVAPSVIFSPKNARFRVQVGTESQVGNLSNSAIKISLWYGF